VNKIDQWWSNMTSDMRRSLPLVIGIGMNLCREQRHKAEFRKFLARLPGDEKKYPKIDFCA
jgi:hypothetical protein